jgi:hypothetical protein
MSVQSRDQDECQRSRRMFMHGYLKAQAEETPDMSVGRAWALALEAAEAMFPMPLTADEVALFDQLSDIEVD